MRVIKFRAWDGNKLLRWDDLWKECQGEICEGMNLTLMQFTGLHDKEGKELWEGDIVFSKWCKEFVGRDDGTYSVIHMCPKLGGWGTYTVKEGECNKWCTHLKTHALPQTKRVGNIHESPELLK